MKEGHEEDKHLVRVRAQVMTRDDSTGGWVPMGVGGLSDVSVHKRTLLAMQLPSCSSNASERGKSAHEYLIFARRISDDVVVLSCSINKDFEYNRVMPTFHHWRTRDSKFGLTFQTAADARAFDKGVCTAVEELLEGLPTSSPPFQSYNQDAGEDDVFMTLNLPVERGDSRSSSDSSTRGGLNNRHDSLMEQKHRLNYLARQTESSIEGDSKISTVAKSSDPWLRAAVAAATSEGKIPSPSKDYLDMAHIDNYSYVQLSAMHEYNYPMLGGLGCDSETKKDLESGLLRQTSNSPKKQPSCSQEISGQGPTAPEKVRKRSGGAVLKIRCRFCQEYFSEDQNKRGACELAPDQVQGCIDSVSCMSGAQCMMYHCMSDQEGEFAQRPCECTGVGQGCGRRWMGLGLLSILVPCLCLYPPLNCCHWCGVKCGLCGGRHAPYQAN
ncbi:sprouty-related, EVH1 domain-containing protein 2 isoform X2 [Neocloeon triangulifer]|uniref:sprouty-related, EVH1 domain-containing protein 2 isoform X2 n=1 Tax=Neocloeon triangulifer TaxID=2078957 RepID=UPI00286F5A67|nr:sprouty-related, EVH1 domain-containing protein 2 isoform X2 [Neocloeon triangulifer]